MSFHLHPALAKKIFLGNLPLCSVLFEDEVHYPWLLLVPRLDSCTNLMQVPQEHLMQLMHELSLAQQVVMDLFHPTQLNVAAIGNRTPQLHIHVIARFADDPAWPKTVWDHPVRAPYPPEQKEQWIKLLRNAFSKEFLATP